MRSIIFLLLLIVSDLPANEQVADKQKITFAAFDARPLFYFDDAGRFTGSLGEAIQRVCLAGNFECVFINFPTARAYREIERGQVDALLTVKSDRFNSCCEASQCNYLWRVGFYHLNEQPEIPLTTEELDGKSLIVIRGWETLYEFFQGLRGSFDQYNVDVNFANSPESALNMLRASRAELLWGGEDFQWIVEAKKLEDVHFTPVMTKELVVWFFKERSALRVLFDQASAKTEPEG